MKNVMRNVGYILALIGLLLASGVIVAIVTAPRWLDVAPTTMPGR